MKKNFLLLSALAVSSLVYSQVGINTPNPQATLDVVGKNTDTTKADGIIAPRLTGDQLKAKDAVYTAAQTGAIVYVTAPVGTSSPKTTNVNATGYYYFDGTIWVSLKSAGSSSTTAWQLVSSDINGPINNVSQNIPAGTGYTTLNNCAVTVTVPAGVSESVVVLNFTGWGHIGGSGNAGKGSLRFQIVQSGPTSATYQSVMMTSYVTPDSGIVRYNYPAAYSVSNLPAGTYTFNLQTRREDETAISSVLSWGTMGRADVFVK